MMEDKTVETVENEEIELSLFLESIFLKYGYDFRSYSREETDPEKNEGFGDEQHYRDDI